MDKVVQIYIKKNGENVEVSNSLGKSMSFKSNNSDYLVNSLFALSVAEYFRHYEEDVDQFTMSLHVEVDKY